MQSVALCATARDWKLVSGASRMDRVIMWFTHTAKYYTATNKNKPQAHATVRVHLTAATGSESSQAQMSTHQDPIFIKNRKNCSTGAVIRDGLRELHCIHITSQLKKQRGTLWKIWHRAKMGGFPKRW